MIIVLGVLPSCYDGGYVEKDRMVPTLSTSEVVIEKNTVYLYGETSVKSPILFFQIAPSELFEESETKIVYAEYEYNNTPNVFAKLDGLIEPGKQYIRLCAQASEDGEIIAAGNFVTIDTPNTIRTLEPQEITIDSVVLYGTYDSQQQFVDYPYFELSTDPDFKELKTYEKLSTHKSEDGTVVFERVIDGLNPSTEYYARFCCRDNNGSYKVDIKGNTIKFNTKEGVFLDVKKITCPNPDYKLSIVVNPQGTLEYIWKTLEFDQNKDSYVLKDKIILQPDIEYNVYVINASGNGCSSLRATNTSIEAMLVNNGGWRIFYGKTVVDFNNPHILLDTKELTCDVTFNFPFLGSGNFSLSLNSEKSILPSDYLNLETCTFSTHKSWNTVIFYNGTPLHMIPFEIENSGDVIIEVSTPKGYYKYNMSRVKMEAGKTYVFNNGVLIREDENMDITDITVNEWDPTNGGSITIKP